MYVYMLDGHSELPEKKKNYVDLSRAYYNAACRHVK